MNEPCDAGDRPLPDDDLVVGDWDTAARVAALLEVVQSFAVLDFTRGAPVGDRGDDLDGLAAGINMLGEELEASHRGLEDRVAERTAELTAFAERLETEVAERRRAEEQLEQANANLRGSVARLEWLDAQIGRLTQMSNLLQVVDSREEAFEVLGRFAPEIFTGTDGGMYVHTPSGDALELAASWGARRPGPSSLAPDDCWALRSGAIHRVEHPDDPVCVHVPTGAGDQALCVPVSLQGHIMGVLHVRWQRPARSSARESSDVGSRGEYERLAVAAGEQFSLGLANLELRAELRAQSIRDALTGLYNRRYLDEMLARELRRAEREATPVSMLMIDIDRFKDFNDNYGHAAGDAVLAEVAGLLRASIRDEDIACRYGGEELAVIMGGIDPEDAAHRAEQVRRTIAARAFTWNDRPAGSLTVSVGVATFPQDASDPDGLVRAADEALYDAKHRGRNRVEIVNRPPETSR